MIKKLGHSEFTRNVLTLMTGTTVAQAVPIAISPILTRIYSPDDFGIYSLFVSITAIFGSIATARYESALILPHDDDDAINIVVLCVCIAGCFSFLLFLIVLFFSQPISVLLGNADIRPWLFLSPFTILLLGLFNTLTFYNTRIKRFKDIAQSNIVKAVFLSIIQVAGGYAFKGVTGLITGQFLSQFFANGRLLKNIVTEKDIEEVINKKKMFQLAAKYRDFPKFSLSAVLANSLSIYSVNIMVSTLYGLSTLGFYSQVQKVLGLPSILIGTSVGQVYYQEAGKERKETGRAINSFIATLKKLLLILPVFVIIYFSVEDVFAFVFGETWRVTGEYAKILTPLFAIRFVSSSLSSTVSIF